MGTEVLAGHIFPAGQGLTVEVDLSGQKLPAGQPAHIVSELGWQGAEMYWPFEHAAHAVQEGAFVESE